MRLVCHRPHEPRRAVFRPGSLELGFVAVRVVAVPPGAILLDAPGDHRFTRATKIGRRSA